MRSITRRCVAVGVGLSLAAPLLAPAPGGALSFADPVGSAVDWLETQQQDDGSFEVAQFPGFETSDAIAAIAAASQTGPRWDDAQALAAVEALVSTQTRTPLDEIDRLVDADGAADPSTDAAGARAAKVIVLVAGPLGLDPTDVDPADDSPAAVDLGARMDLHRQGDGSYDFGAQFNGTLYSALALQVRGEVVPQGLIDQIIAAQRADGSWDYTGTPAGGPGEDVDTTALALLALSAGLAPTPALSPDAPAGPKASIQAGVNFLASRQQASGAWQAFGADDPNSTALATIAIFGFIGNWNNFLGPLVYINKQELYTLALGLNLFRGQYVTYYNQLMAVSILSLAPILIIFFFTQKTFIRGIALTGIKG